MKGKEGMPLAVEERKECRQQWRELEQMSKLKYLRCVRVLHEALLVPVLLYGSETKMEIEGDIVDQSCTDGQPQSSVRD